LETSGTLESKWQKAEELETGGTPESRSEHLEISGTLERKWKKEDLEWSKMTDTVKINKHGQPVEWHGQSWVYYKGMMKIVFAEKEVLDYATGTKTVADAKDQAEFNKIQVKIMQTIMASLSMELGQQVMGKKTGTEMWQQDLVALVVALHPQDLVSHLLGRVHLLRPRLHHALQPIEALVLRQRLHQHLGEDRVSDICVESRQLRLDREHIVHVLHHLLVRLALRRLQPVEQDDLLVHPCSRIRLAFVSILEVGRLWGQAVQSEGTAERMVDLAEGRCFKCHEAGHRKTECPDLIKATDTSGRSKKRKVFRRKRRWGRVAIRARWRGGRVPEDEGGRRLPSTATARGTRQR